jgi:signal transduction histidine kinase
MENNRAPLIEVNIPIHARGETTLLGCAQLMLDARDLAADCARLDRNLAWEAMAVFVPGAIILTGALGWAYRRLQRTNRLLEERTAGLLRANHELTLAAKTGALGAVTAHLIHGLSNPLANLEDFVTARGSLGQGDEDWRDAIAATDRMRRLVHEVVRVLGEETGGDRYEMSLEECGKVLAGKVQPVAREFGVVCEIVVLSRRRLANHPANIVLLILDNLINNSLQVTAPGKKARVTIRDGEEGVVCEVADEGPGFPEALTRTPFAPCRSTKGGAGLGLAISQQLAVHLGGRLELRETGAAGTLIWLRLPRAVFEETATTEGRAGLAKRSHSMVEES